MGYSQWSVRQRPKAKFRFSLPATSKLLWPQILALLPTLKVSVIGEIEAPLVHEHKVLSSPELATD